MKRFTAVVLVLSLLPTAPVVRATAQDPTILTAMRAAGIKDIGAAFEALYTGMTNHLPTLLKSSPAVMAAMKTWSRRALVLLIENTPKLAEFIAQRIGQYVARGVAAEEIVLAMRTWAFWEPLGAISLSAGTGLVAAISALLVVIVGVLALGTGYVAATNLLEEEDLKVSAAETAQFLAVNELLFNTLRAGRAKLLPGLDLPQALRKVQENLEVGRAPFLNVFEVRPCPDISGGWVGDIVVKEVSGSTPIKAGQSRPANGTNFVITQTKCAVKLTFANNEISGTFGVAETIASSIGGKTERMEVDNVSLTVSPTGALTRADLMYYGQGGGSLTGKLRVELEQTPKGATIVSGGLLIRQGK